MEHQPDRIDVEELVERLDRAETELSALKALVGRMVEGLERSRDALHAAYERTGHVDDLAEAHIAASLLSEAKGEGER